MEMKLGYTIVYVPDVSESLGFFERAFGFKPRFVHESGTYGELDTGETTLASRVRHFCPFFEQIWAPPS